LVGRVRKMAQRPNRQFGPVGYSQFSEYPVQILFYGAFGKVQLVGDLFVQFGLCDEVDYLFFSEAQVRIERSLAFPFRVPTARTNSVPALTPKIASASEAASNEGNRPEFNRCHDTSHSHFGLIG
jgi:hypothetical protein